MANKTKINKSDATYSNEAGCFLDIGPLSASARIDGAASNTDVDTHSSSMTNFFFVVVLIASLMEEENRPTSL